MNKAELVKAVADTAAVGLSETERVIKAFERVLTRRLAAGDSVLLVGFGSFEVAERAEREGRNPQTGEPMTIAAAKVVKFKAGKALKEAVNA